MLVSLLYLFSFLSFNTKAMMPDDARLEPTAALVRSADADFVFLTEEYTGQIGAALKDKYPYSAKARSHIDETERFFCKYPIAAVDEICVIPSGKYMDCWVHRVLVVPAKGDTLSLYCCHLPHGYNERMSIVSAVVDDIAKGRRDAIVGGDMNSIALSLPMLMFLSSGMKDAWTEKGQGSSATFHGSGLNVRIDYIFHTPALVTKRALRISGSGISDHDAMFAEFEKKK